VNEPTTSCGPGGSCGTCPTPCFLLGEDDSAAFDSLVERGPEGDFDELAEAVGDTDTFALGCARWDNPDADCNACEGNFFCWADAEAAD
jgi:hypothetical protein